MKIKLLIILATTPMLLIANSINESANQHFNNVRDFWRNTYKAFSKNSNSTISKLSEEKIAAIETIRKEWKKVDFLPAIKAPVLPPMPPVIKNGNDSIPHISPIPVIIPEPEPEPIIKENITDFFYYGTNIKVPTLADDNTVGDLQITTSDAVADGWSILCKSNADSIAKSLYTKANELQINDYGYLLLCEAYSKSIYPSNNNASVLLWSYIFSSVGYKIKLGFYENAELHFMFATNYTVFNWDYWYLDGYKYYNADNRGSYDQYGKDSKICPTSLGGEKLLSFEIDKSPLLALNPSEGHVLRSRHVSDCLISVNKNLIDYYNDFCKIGDSNDPLSYFTFRATAPLSEHVKEQLYPALKKSITDKNQFESLCVLLNFCHNAFPYTYDSIAWGRSYSNERAFFPEESLYYPGSDCEDHAILFSRLVRDILNLDACLLYYPGHISTCIHITDGSMRCSSHYFDLEDGQYIICDPTYFGADAGEPMPQHKNVSAKILQLPKVSQ